jgi:hypothetical protein
MRLLKAGQYTIKASVITVGILQGFVRNVWGDCLGV